MTMSVPRARALGESHARLSTRTTCAAGGPVCHAVATVADVDSPRPDEFGRPQPLGVELLGVELLGERLVLARLQDRSLRSTAPARIAALGCTSAGSRRTSSRSPVATMAPSGARRDWADCALWRRTVTPRRAGESGTTPSSNAAAWCGCASTRSRASPVLDLPEAADPDFVHIPIYVETWNAVVGRMLEATLDT